MPLPEGLLRPASGSGVDPTQLGAALGTPAYMAPEQAAGQLDQLGPATDIYALGATLFNILTDRPPVDGEDIGEVLRKVQSGEVGFNAWRSRLGAGGVSPLRKAASSLRGLTSPAQLRAICLKAMSVNPADRYASALDLARDVERCLADEPVSAYPEPLRLRLRRFARRHRTLVTSAAAVLVVALLGLAVVAALLSLKNSELTTAYTQEQAARTRAQEAEEQARTSAATAATQRQLALATLSSVVADIHGELRGRSELQDLRKKLLGTAQTGLEKVARSADTATGIDRGQLEVQRQLGDIFVALEIGGTQKGLSHWKNARDLARALAAADPKDRERQRELAQVLLRLANAHQLLAQSQEASESALEGVALLESLQEGRQLSAADREELTEAYAALGDILLLQGRLSDAAPAYRKSHAYLTETANPNEIKVFQLLMSYIKQVEIAIPLGELDKAGRFAEEAVKLAKAMVMLDPAPGMKHALSRALTKQGDVARERKDWPIARAAFQQTLELDREFARADPQNADLQRSLYLSLVRLGEIHFRLKEHAQAQRLYDESLQLRRQLHEADPKNELYRRELAILYLRRGDLFQKQGDYAAARDAFHHMRKLTELGVAADPETPQMKAELALAWLRLGGLDLELQDFAAAHQDFQQACDVLLPLVEGGVLSRENELVDSAQQQRRTAQMLQALAPAWQEQAAWPLIWGWPRF
jgi:tetratricopeptide (TPR) repeat protein